LVSQAIELGGVVTEKASGKADELRRDPRFARAVGSAELVANTVHERVVQPVLSRAGITTTPSSKAAKKPTGTVPAQTKPAPTASVPTESGATDQAQSKPAQSKPARTKPTAASTAPTLHAVKPTTASARAPRKSTAKPDVTE
jgi:hypothetical protein